MSNVVSIISDDDDEETDSRWLDRLQAQNVADTWRDAACEAEDHAMRILSGEWPPAAAAEALRAFATVCRVNARDWAKTAESAACEDDETDSKTVIN